MHGTGRNYRIYTRSHMADYPNIDTNYVGGFGRWCGYCAVAGFDAGARDYAGVRAQNYCDFHGDILFITKLFFVDDCLYGAYR